MAQAFPIIACSSHHISLLTEQFCECKWMEQDQNIARGRRKGFQSWQLHAERIPNMNMVAFEAATGAAFVRKLTPLYTTMPSDDELRSPDAILLLGAIVEFLKGIPRWHRRTWQKMINKSFPELGSVTLDLALQKLVVRCICTERVLCPGGV